MPTVRDVWRAIFPAAASHAGPRELARAVGWVRVLKTRVPAFDALEPDDLAILPAPTLESLAATAIDAESVVEAVGKAGGSAVLIVGERAAADTTEAVIRRAAALGVAAFVLPDGDPSALERSAIGYIVNGQAELDRRVADLEGRLEQAALAGAGPAGLAATIARFLGRPVVIEGRDGSAVAVHAPVGNETDTPAVGEYLKRRRGAALRVALPAPGTGEVGQPADRRGGVRSAGALLLLGSGPTTELERLAARRVATLLALELGRTSPGGTSTGERGIEALPEDGPPWVVMVARQIDDDVPTSLAEREEVRATLRRAEPRRRLALRGDAGSLELRLVAATAPDDPDGMEMAARASSLIGRPVVVAGPFDEREARAVVEAQARATLEALENLSAVERRELARRDGALVVRAELLPALRLLTALPQLPDGARHAAALLEPVLVGHRGRDRDTLATLRAVLDHPGLAEAAAALGIHRNTLTYRLRRLEARTGWRLNDPLLRFTLGLAVRIVQSSQVDEPAGVRRRPPGPTGRE